MVTTSVDTTTAPHTAGGVIDVFDPRGRAGGEEWGRTIPSGHWTVTGD